MKNLIIVLLMIFTCSISFSQTWQPIGIPEGSGVTDMVYWEGSSPFDDKLWVTTGSVDWPTGQRGGVFYSATTPPYQGIWYRIGGSAGYYVGRTLEVGQDGNLYASLWRDPINFPADALCRFVPQAATFGLLYQVQAGDNIFSIAVKNNPHTIFGGTRNGVIRSTDNGTTFGYSNTGIPGSAWVYDIAIDSSGILAIASSKGVFISSDNGDNWLTTTGIPPGDTVSALLFGSSSSSVANPDKSLLVQEDDWLYAGTYNGKLLQSFKDSAGYTVFVVAYFFTDPEDAELTEARQTAGRVIWGVYQKSQGNYNQMKISETNNVAGVYESTDDGTTWNQINNGLPPNPPVSALAFKEINQTSYQLYSGLFNDKTNGAGVFKLDIVVDVDETNNQIPTEFKLEQNYPNPFNPSTTIQFSIPGQSFVKLEIFNALGEKITTLVSKELNMGNYMYEWNAENLPSGTYLYKLQTSAFTESKKMILIK